MHVKSKTGHPIRSLFKEQTPLIINVNITLILETVALQLTDSQISISFIYSDRLLWDSSVYSSVLDYVTIVLNEYCKIIQNLRTNLEMVLALVMITYISCLLLGGGLQPCRLYLILAIFFKHVFKG